MNKPILHPKSLSITRGPLPGSKKTYVNGVPFKEKAKITGFRSYLKDVMAQADALRKQGVPADEAARRVDLTSHRTDFPEIRQPGAEVRGVRRLYEYLAEREKPGRSGR